jgi:RelB Antitoxin alpha helical domain
MLEITKNYVTDENQQPIAVQIPIAEFERIEEILENYGLVHLMEESEDEEAAWHRLAAEQLLKGYSEDDAIYDTI